MTMKGETVLSGAEHPVTRLSILHSPAGYYLVFLDKQGRPYSRESGYLSQNAAQDMLRVLRMAPEMPCTSTKSG